MLSRISRSEIWAGVAQLLEQRLRLVNGVGGKEVDNLTSKTRFASGVSYVNAVAIH